MNSIKVRSQFIDPSRAIFSAGLNTATSGLPVPEKRKGPAMQTEELSGFTITKAFRDLNLRAQKSWSSLAESVNRWLLMFPSG